jgi:hypothetical protein
MLSPVLAVTGTVYQTAPVVYEAKDFDSDVLVDEGDTLYYTLDQLVLPSEMEIPDVTLPDFTGSTVFVKVMQIQDEYEFNIDVTGTLIYYAVGLILNEDKVLTIGAGLTATDIILTEGSGTPAIEMSGVPHWNTTFNGPALFFINNDYAEHNAFLTGMNFTVTDTVDNFHAVLTNETSGGSIEGNWRKSDGVCTYLLIDDIKFSDADFSGFTIELTLDRLEKRPLPVTAGDVIEWTADMIEVGVSGDLINETTLSMINEDIADIKAAYEGKVLMKQVVLDVEGCYYLCDTYMYDNWTDSLIKSEYPTVFNGFVGSINNHDPFYYSIVATPGKGPSYDYWGGPGPFCTPDWDIYEAQMKMYNNILSNYVVDILEFMSPPPDLTFHAIDGTFELVSKKDFYYFYEILSVNIEEDLDTTSISFVPEMAYEMGSIYQMREEGYLCYHQSGIGAVIRANVDMQIEVYDPSSYYDTGLMNIDVDIKLRNHDYDPPEIIGRGILPGYNWIIAIPALLSLAAIGLINRRRK